MAFTERTVLRTEVFGGREPNTSDPSNVLEFLNIDSVPCAKTRCPFT